MDVVYTESQEGTSETDGNILVERTELHGEMRENGFYYEPTVENAIGFVQNTMGDVYPELKTVNASEKDAVKRVLSIIGQNDIADVYDPDNPGSAMSALARV